MSHGRRKQLENPIQAEVEAGLGAEPDLLLVRNSTGVAKYFTEAGREYHVPYGLGRGSPDLVGILCVNGIGRWFCLEIKAPEGELEDEQKKCHAIWRRFGAFVEVVHSVAEAREALERARKELG